MPLIRATVAGTAPAAADSRGLAPARGCAHLRAVVEVYGGDHGWCVPDNGAYQQAEAEWAWAALLGLYRQALV